MRKMGFEDIAMEYFVAENRRPVAACLESVRRCDLYVGLFAWRYGDVPKDDNPHRYSMTEMEYREALASKKDCIILLVKPEAPWPRQFMDADTSRIDAFRQELGTSHVCAFFSSAQDIGGVVATALHAWAKQRPSATGNARISTAKLPSTNPILIGRDEEILRLDAAWNNPNVRVLSIVGTGGAGKSSLVNAWINKLAMRRWSDAQMVYGWSFYRQGTYLGTQTSADLFLASALAWFGDPTAA
jgi:hypothetical protein